MWLDNAVIAILLISELLVLAKSSLIPEEGHYNSTTELTSSPWIKKATNHFRPRPPGCWKTPWICKDGETPGARMRCCRNQCVDVFSDPNNCGWCGIRCPFTWQCCRGFCVDTNRNPFNCGRCGNRCPWGVQCVYGMCGYGGGATPTPPWPWPRPPQQPEPWPRPPWPRPPQQPKPWPFKPPHPPKGDKPPAMSSSSSS